MNMYVREHKSWFRCIKYDNEHFSADSTWSLSYSNGVQNYMLLFDTSYASLCMYKTDYRNTFKGWTWNSSILLYLSVPTPFISFHHSSYYEISLFEDNALSKYKIHCFIFVCKIAIWSLCKQSVFLHASRSFLEVATTIFEQEQQSNLSSTFVNDTWGIRNIFHQIYNSHPCIKTWYLLNPEVWCDS